MDGEWSSPELLDLARLFLANETALGLGGAGLLPGRLRDRLQHALRANSRRRARRNISAHYDLGNDFYGLWLDRTMTYSAALFAAPDEPLEGAQRRKYRRIAELAGVEPGMRVLEIGCGWGGFAEVAASELGCHVTGITLSSAQTRFARERLAAAGLGDRTEIRVADYREVRGRFDAIVSIEMLEAVGHRYLPRFFAACERLLEPGGRVGLQSITIPDQLYDRYRRGTDWIRKHIFPGGHLPSLGALQQAMARSSSLVVRQLDDIAPHYAATLERWRRRFRACRAEIAGLGFDDRFVRMWEFYLATCAAAFAHRKLGSLQLSLARAGDRAGAREETRCAC
jgi:cyclopropane-fatty-acyl-phospholipid synthase